MVFEYNSGILILLLCRHRPTGAIPPMFCFRSICCSAAVLLMLNAIEEAYQQWLKSRR